MLTGSSSDKHSQLRSHAAERDTHIDDNHFDGSKNVFGFWIYIMTDCILFASLFAVYAVLHTHTFGGPHAKELFSLPFVLTETLLLLTSSFTYGLAMLARESSSSEKVTRWMWVTLVLGLCFIAMESYEFRHLYLEGHTWTKSAFLSSFFTLVATHGLHVTVGLIWMLAIIIQINVHGITPITKTKFTCLGLFWHFLDIVWIFVFSVVYLMGAI
ncbi:cytochrome o ubiquinol oxidase subunit III [Legionella qingyii]|uniref:Cytochrome bo(3) ubiquinol oxidase subunit 3 n=2 Tax=Legionella qingyii TaxID=2184757 RepID=A0A317U1Q2_9GAMM|nr:cytochrome o ubiquinol oxidase subunit III [Legionella qingyii]RUR22574.1 cytochrome o ubiquinol oxidase subunit III [Legionella qingyii]RUR28047.1 cytochrome o ubiquinol oxidase subunit III [Legionella qingyii]